MSANTAGGAAGQCTDLMNDFKVGKAIGATPAKQVAAQCLGIAIGSVVGVLVYRALIRTRRRCCSPRNGPAPAVATWKAVAQTLTAGLDSLSVSVRLAILLGGLAGLALGVLETVLPARRARYLPSAAALGLAFILPASVSGMMAAGAILAWLVSLRFPRLTERYAITAAAGLIAGKAWSGSALRSGSCSSAPDAGRSGSLHRVGPARNAALRPLGPLRRPRLRGAAVLGRLGRLVREALQARQIFRVARDLDHAQDVARHQLGQRAERVHVDALVACEASTPKVISAVRTSAPASTAEAESDR
jgi:hypothetical protein